MKELNNKQTKLISGGISQGEIGIIGMVGIAGAVVGLFTAMYAYCSGSNAAYRQLKAEKELKGDHITYIDSKLDAELAALAHYQKHGGGSYEAMTNDQFGRPSAPPFEHIVNWGG